ncbi:hypothetical protein AGMMS50267_15630 [Spirochaetia bacterium]|nr:hypothetical protein AGMMS50267_15630 [Spirochaetia bacterium]
MALSWYKPCGADELNPEGQRIDALLIAAGYTRQERVANHNAGMNDDLTICNCVYSRGEWDKVFLIIHTQEAPASGGAV